MPVSGNDVCRREDHLHGRRECGAFEVRRMPQRRVRLANDRGAPRRDDQGVAEPGDRSGSERLLSAHDL